MRCRPLLVLATITSIFILLTLRRHVGVLNDTVHTYSAFYPLLRAHPSILYRYPTPVDGDRLPKVFHHVAIGNVSVAKHQDYANSCRALHPGWRFNLWTEDNDTAFLAEYYPDILPHYTSYRQNIQRANVLRYAVLHKYGGVYLDLDITCLKPLDETPLVRLPFASPGAHPAGVNNAFILARPGHAFLLHLLKSVPAHNLSWRLPIRLPYVENMLSTGCMYYSNMWMRYVGDVIAGRQQDKVYILSDEKGDLEPHMWRGAVQSPVVSHAGASSWHSWDAAAILAIGKHGRLIVLCAAVGVTFGVMASLYRRSHTRRQRCRVWKRHGSGRLMEGE